MSFLVLKEQQRLLAMAIDQMRANGMKDDDPHGASHLLNVYVAFEKLFSEGKCGIRGLDLNLLQIAIFFHDVGRGLEKKPGYEKFGGNHAFISEKLFMDYDLGITAEEKRMIAYAIRYHNQGLRHRGIWVAEKAEDILAQALVCVDCCDGLNPPRVEKWAREQGIPSWDDTPLAEFVKDWESGEKIPENKKNSSLVYNLVFNYNLMLPSAEALAPIMDLIVNKEVFEAEMEEMRRPVREFINAMIEERKKELAKIS